MNATHVRSYDGRSQQNTRNFEYQPGPLLHQNALDHQDRSRIPNDLIHHSENSNFNLKSPQTFGLDHQDPHHRVVLKRDSIVYLTPKNTAQTQPAPNSLKGAQSPFQKPGNEEDDLNL